MNTPVDLLPSALAYASAGIPVYYTNLDKVPAVPPSMDEDGRLIPGSGGIYGATLEEKVLRRWNLQGKLLGIGLQMGALDKPGAMLLLAIDADVKQENGILSLKRLCFGYDYEPEESTWVQYTPSGGMHAIFVATEEQILSVSNQVDSIPALPGCDIRGKGAGIIAAPTELPSGRYTSNRHKPDMLPDWLFAVLKRERKVWKPHPYRAPMDVARRERYWAEETLLRIADDISSAPKGSRNQTLFLGALRCFRICLARLLNWKHARNVLMSAAAELVTDDGERACMATLASAERIAREEGPFFPDLREPLRGRLSNLRSHDSMPFVQVRKQLPDPPAWMDIAPDCRDNELTEKIPLYKK